MSLLSFNRARHAGNDKANRVALVVSHNLGGRLAVERISHPYSLCLNITSLPPEPSRLHLVIYLTGIEHLLVALVMP